MAYKGHETRIEFEVKIKEMYHWQYNELIDYIHGKHMFKLEKVGKISGNNPLYEDITIKVTGAHKTHSKSYLGLRKKSLEGLIKLLTEL